MHEGQPIGLARPRQRGTELGDARDAARDIRQLVMLASVHVVQEHVRYGIAVADVCNALAVGCPLRVDAQARLVRQYGDPASRHVVQADLPAAETQHVEIRLRTAVARERDRATIRRDVRHEVTIPIVGQHAETSTVHRDDREIRDTTFVRAEDDVSSIRREHGAQHTIDRQVHSSCRAATRAHDVEHILSVALADIRDLVPVRRKGTLAVEQPQFFGIRIRGALYQPAYALAGACVGEPEVDEDFAAQEVAVRQEQDLRAVVRQRRCEEDVAAAFLRVQQVVGKATRPVEICDGRQMLLLHRVLPVVAQLLERKSELALECTLDAHVRHRLEDLPDDLVAPPLADVAHQRLAEPVREKAIRRHRHLLDGRDVAIDGSIAEPHVGEPVIGAQRQVLRHAFHEPERRVHRLQCLQVRTGTAAREHVILELVHHFVRQHMLEGAIVAGQRQHVALSLRVGDTTGTFAEVTENVVLRKVGAARENHDRLPLAELVAEDSREPRVRALGHARGVLDRGLLFLVIVHAEVLGLEHAPLESLVLGLVFPEVTLRAGGRGQCQCRGNCY